MGVFRYRNKFSAPTTDQRERYMIGKIEEYYFGPENQVILTEYSDAIYLKDIINNIRILFTGLKDKQKAFDEAKRLADFHYRKLRNKYQPE